MVMVMVMVIVMVNEQTIHSHGTLIVSPPHASENESSLRWCTLPLPSLRISALERILQTHPKNGPVGVNPTLKPDSKYAGITKWKPLQPRDYGCAILSKKDCVTSVDECTWNAGSVLASGTCDACPTVYHGDGQTDEEKKKKCEVATVNGGGMPMHNRCKIKSAWWGGWECLQSPALERFVKAGRAVRKKTEAREDSKLSVFRNPTLTPS